MLFYLALRMGFGVVLAHALTCANILWDVPLYRQTTNYSCGPATVKIALQYYGKIFDEDFLIRQLGADPEEGTPIENLRQFIEKQGLRAEVKHESNLDAIRSHLTKRQLVIVDAQAWGKEAHSSAAAGLSQYENTWDDGHYMVVIGMDSQHIYFSDPALSSVQRGKIKLSEFLLRWHDMEKGGRKRYRTALFITGPLQFPGDFAPID